MPCFKSVPARAARARPRSASPDFPMRPHARLQSCPHRVVTRVSYSHSYVMEPVQLGPACVRSAHRHSLEDARVGLSQTDRPVAAIGRRSEGGVHFRELELSPGRAPDVARSPAACPSRRAEPARPPPRTLRRDGRESALRCARTSKPSGAHPSSGPPRTRSRRLRPGTAATASRVSRSAARASRAACSGLHGGQRRVLEKPGAGALAMTITAGGSSQGGPWHRRCGLVPSPIPVTFERGASCASRACARTPTTPRGQRTPLELPPREGRGGAAELGVLEHVAAIPRPLPASSRVRAASVP